MARACMAEQDKIKGETLCSFHCSIPTQNQLPSVHFLVWAGAVALQGPECIASH